MAWAAEELRGGVAVNLWWPGYILTRIFDAGGRVQRCGLHPREPFRCLRTNRQGQSSCSGTSQSGELLTARFSLYPQTWPDCRLSCAIWNAVGFSISPFLDMSSSDIQRSVQTNIVAASTFAQLAIRRLLTPLGAADPARAGTFHKGSLIFTGGTAALTGHTNLGAHAAGKHGLRAISQSVAREFGPQGVHVAFVVSA